MARSIDLPDPYGYIQNWRDQLPETGWWHSFELPDGRVISGVSSVAAQQSRLAQFAIPNDLRGKRVLDIGTWDGWFAMEMEKRGAEVVAIDRWDNPQFHQIHEMLSSHVEYIQMSVYDLHPSQIGRFDIVLFMGVLYHLKHPLLALERVASVANDFVAVESFVLRERHRPGIGIEQLPMMEFYEGEDFGGQFDNWIAPTVPCLLALCRTAGFARVVLNNVHEYGAAIRCERTWPLPPHTQNRTGLTLLSVFHNDTRGLNFQSLSSDDYVACRLAAEGIELSLETVWPEVGGYGVAPVFVGMVEGQWQVNFKLPPGLSSGWHAVRIRTPAGDSNSYEIAVDIPCIAESLRIKSTADAISWEPSRISLQNEHVAIWLSGLPKNADLYTVKVWVAKRRLLTTFVGPSGPDGIGQVNARLICPEMPGTKMLYVSVGDVQSDPIEIELER